MFLTLTVSFYSHISICQCAFNRVKHYYVTYLNCLKATRLWINIRNIVLRLSKCFAYFLQSLKETFRKNRSKPPLSLFMSCYFGHLVIFVLFFSAVSLDQLVDSGPLCKTFSLFSISSKYNNGRPGSILYCSNAGHSHAAAQQMLICWPLRSLICSAPGSVIWSQNSEDRISSGLESWIQL